MMLNLTKKEMLKGALRRRKNERQCCTLRSLSQTKTNILSDTVRESSGRVVMEPMKSKCISNFARLLMSG